LSSVQTSASVFMARVKRTAEVVGLFGSLLGGGLAILGPVLISLLYGNKYAASFSVVPWLAASQGLWMIRVGPTIIALARGDSVNAMLSNIWRASALGPALIAGIFGSPRDVSIVAFGGEAIALAASIIYLSRRQSVAARVWFWPTMIAACLITLSVLLECFWLPSNGQGDSLAWGIIAAGMLSVGVGTFFPRARRELVALALSHLKRPAGFMP
jgi:hypothetical protein